MKDQDLSWHFTICTEKEDAAGAASLVLDRFRGIIDIMIQTLTNIKS